MMAQYRKKPVVIDAYQWKQHFNHIVTEFDPYEENKAFTCGYCDEPAAYHGWIKTAEGGHIACPNDWIITGVKGEHYPCKPDIFEATYEPVEKGSK